MIKHDIELRISEADLLKNLSEGDQRAFKKIYDLYHNSIYRYALHLLKSETLAEENLQETFLALWNLRLRAADIESIEAYLVRISRNRAIDLLRKSKLVIRTEAEIRRLWEETHNETEEQITLDDTRKVLQQGVALLPAQQRLAFELCHVQGLKYEQAAVKMGISVNTVKLHMKLALRFLRKYIARCTDLAVFYLILKLF